MVEAYRYKQYRESGYADVFSGMYDYSKWLRLDNIVTILRIAGSEKIDILETRGEQNGPRSLLIAERN